MTKSTIRASSGFTIFCLSVLLAHFMASCRNEAVTRRTEYEEPLLSSVEECEYRQRRTNEAVYNWTGEIELHDTISQVYYIRAARPGKIRLHACNLPAEFQVHGIKVKFSGEIKAVQSDEMRIALPFVIAEIFKLEK